MLKMFSTKMYRMTTYLTGQTLISCRWHQLESNLQNHKLSHLGTLYDESAQIKDI